MSLDFIIRRACWILVGMAGWATFIILTGQYNYHFGC
jgi:hypothetical protein